MIIKLHLVNEFKVVPEISLSGLTLTIGDQVVDLSQIPVGGYAIADEASPFVTGSKVTRYYAEIMYPYSTQYHPSIGGGYALEQPDFGDITLNDGDTLVCPLIEGVRNV